MGISGFFFFNRKQWGDLTTTFDVNCGRQPTLAEASLNMTLDTGFHAVGIRSFLTRNTPVSDEQLVDCGQFYWQWPGSVFDQTMTQVTFACGTHEDTQLTGHYQLLKIERLWGFSSGRTEAGATVSVLDGTKVVGGSWSLTASNLADGAHTTVTDTTAIEVLCPTCVR